jgi:hypothetical protein
MDAFLSQPYVPWALLALLAVSLFAAGYGRVRRRSAAPARIPAQESKKMMPVMEAAAAAYEAAKRERMVIVTVAEGARGVDPIAWFARSIAGVVSVYRKLEAGAFEKIDNTASVGTEPQSLYIRKRNYQTYIGWARSMQ